MPRQVELRPLDEIVPAPRNAKDHDEPLIAASIDRFGYVELVHLDDRTGRILSGHGRLGQIRARRDAGLDPPDDVEVSDDGRWLVPVVTGWASKNDLEADAAAVALNRIGARGGWREDVLAEVLADLIAADPILDGDPLFGTGFTAEDYAELLAIPELGPVDPPLPDPRVDDDEAPEPQAEPTSRHGDVWLCGAHRVACGDSTQADAVQRLMAEAKAAGVWTDPPYGVEYVGKTKKALTISNDGKQGLRPFIHAVVRAVTPHIEPGAMFYMACPAGPQGTEMRLGLADAGWRLHQELVWIKDVFVLGHSDYHYRHEPILYGYTPGPGRSGRGNHAGSRWRGDHASDSVLEVPRPKRSEVHPTMKPVELIARCLRNSTSAGEVVLDPFGGSGSTLIAAHRLGRIGYIQELDPIYVDVILRRWAAYTGQTPVREADGQPFPG